MSGTYRRGAIPLVYRQTRQSTEVPVDTGGEEPGIVDMDDIREHNSVVLTNNSGSDRLQGDVVVLDTTMDNAFTTTTTASYSASAIGVLQENVSKGQSGLVAFGGWVDAVNLGGSSPTRGHYLFTATTAGRATTSASRAAGAFGQVATNDADSAAVLFGEPDSSGGGGASGSMETLLVTINGYGAVIPTGIAGDATVDWTGTIRQVRAYGYSASGSIVVDVWKDTDGNFPPTDADSITASAPITISSALKSTDSTLTGWTTSVTAGDILRFNVDSVSTFVRVLIAIKVERS